MNMLALDQVEHRFGGFTVLRSVTFSVPEAGIVGLIGPNGSGKTTLFNIISGYLALQAGSIMYDGRALSTQSVQDRSRAGMVRTFQTPKIFERMTVLENIMAGACKITRTGIVQDLLRSPHARSELRRLRTLAESVAADLGLAEDLPAANLTAGQRRILEIARALIATIERLNDAGLAILLVSHDMELMAVAETVHVLNFGEIIARGDMAAIQQNAGVREVYLGM
jgi:ABC-type branched-subunit amino acid transport system ATPase component